MTIPYPLARLLGSLAEDEALALGVPMVTAVVDRAGDLQFFGRMDGALRPASNWRFPRLSPPRFYACPRMKSAGWPGPAA